MKIKDQILNHSTTGSWLALVGWFPLLVIPALVTMWIPQQPVPGASWHRRERTCGFLVQGTTCTQGWHGSKWWAPPTNQRNGMKWTGKKPSICVNKSIGLYVYSRYIYIYICMCFFKEGGWGWFGMVGWLLIMMIIVDYQLSKETTTF